MEPEYGTLLHKYLSDGKQNTKPVPHTTFVEWSTKVRSAVQSLGPVDIEVKVTSAKIRRMSKRRQKKAMAKRPYKLLRNCFPVATAVKEDVESGVVTLDITFRPEPAGGGK